MRGDNSFFIAASVVDREGETQYHVVPTYWVRIGMLCIGLLLALAVLLGVLIVANKYEIDKLRDQIQVEEDNTNNGINTQHPNR